MGNASNNRPSRDTAVSFDRRGTHPAATLLCKGLDDARTALERARLDVRRAERDACVHAALAAVDRMSAVCRDLLECHHSLSSAVAAVFAPSPWNDALAHSGGQHRPACAPLVKRDSNLPDEIDPGTEDDHDDAAFLACLAERNRQRRAVSEKNCASAAHCVFAEMPEAKGVSKARLKASIERLLRLGRIERGELPWENHNKPVEGLRERSE